MSLTNTSAIIVTFIILLLDTALILVILPPRALQVSIQETALKLLGPGPGRLNDVIAAVQAAQNQRDITMAQKRILQLSGVVVGIPYPSGWAYFL